MKKTILIAILAAIPVTAAAQGAIDAYRLSQPDLKGTARFMSMGGAFGALGGDLSTLSQNPAGIGIYRSNEIGITGDIDFQHSSSAGGTTQNQTLFHLNNVGAIGTIKLPSNTVPNINIGFTYNKAASFNRQYSGGMVLGNSLSNYIAGVANGSKLSVADVTTTDGYDPYNPTDGKYASPWLAILGYDSYLIDAEGNPDQPTWYGQWDNGTSGVGRFSVSERGSVNEYNIALGGNIANSVYWGMNFDIVNASYSLNAIWNENLQNAYVFDEALGASAQMSADWSLRNLYHASANGFNYQLGLIFKPVQEFRVGFAFHTPTWYHVTESSDASVRYSYDGSQYYMVQSNNGTTAFNDFNLRTPWKFIVSAAGVIGSKFIISADYEWQSYNTMKLSTPSMSGYVYDDYYPWDWDYGYTPYSYDSGYDYYSESNSEIRNIYKTSHQLRLGAEYRVTPNFSIRAGYSFVTSPVKAEARDNRMDIYTAGMIPSYRFDNDTNYATCGLGYRTGGFYVDLAYVYKNMQSTYHAFSPDVSSAYAGPQSKLSLSNSQIIISTGFKF